MAKLNVGKTVESLGDYLREQRSLAQMSLRQLAEQSDVSNPYLSQIERGLPDGNMYNMHSSVFGATNQAWGLPPSAYAREAHALWSRRDAAGQWKRTPPVRHQEFVGDPRVRALLRRTVGDPAT